MDNVLLLEANSSGFGLLVEDMLDIIVESVSDESGKKKFYATGLFSEAEVKLRNPRIYRKYLLEREVDKFKSVMENGQSWGELEHPKTATINTDRVCLITKDLSWEGNKLIGKAEILENDMGQKYLSFLKAGKPGVSTRSTGSVKDGYVLDNLNLITWDGVLRPSANSVLSSIYESYNVNDLITNGMSDEDLYNFVKDIERDKYYGLTKKDFDDAIIGRFKILMDNAFKNKRKV
jgi:hypothetical protein